MTGRSLTSRLVSVLALLVAFAAAAPLAAQQGRVMGKVLNHKGEGVEGAKITLTTPALTTYKLELASGKEGKYSFIVPDATRRYNMVIEKDGFAKWEQKEMKFPIGDTFLLDPKLVPPQAAVAAPQAQQSADPFVVAYNDAVGKAQAGDLDAALVKVEEAIKLSPEKLNGYDLATKIALQKKDWDKVIQYGEKALTIEADNPPVYGYIAQAYRQKGDKAKAAEWEKKFAAANPDQPSVILNQGIDLYNKGDFKAAEPLFKKVLAAEPENAKAHFLLGMSYASLGKVPEMNTHLNEYLRLDPKGADAGAAKEMLDAFK